MPHPARAFLSALMACTLLTGPTPVLAQDPQMVPSAPLQQLDKLRARLEGVRYENVDAAQPSVVLYLTIHNPGGAPAMLAANTFENSSLTGAIRSSPRRATPSRAACSGARKGPSPPGRWRRGPAP